jgi:serine protease
LTAGSGIKGQQAVATPALDPLPTMSMDRAMAFINAASQKTEYLPGQVVVKFKDGVSIAQQQRALDASRGHPSVDSLEWAGSVAIVRDASEPDARQMAERLAAQPEVQYAEPNYIRHYKLTPNDPGFSARQWNFPAIDLPRAWDINPGAKSSVIIAIVDTGVTTVNQSFTTQTWNGTAVQTINVAYAVNPDLSSSRLASPVDFINSSGGSMVLDSDGHGTHVSSTAGEDTNNNLADAGIAYNAKIMPVKVCASYWDVQFPFTPTAERIRAIDRAAVPTWRLAGSTTPPTTVLGHQPQSRRRQPVDRAGRD